MGWTNIKEKLRIVAAMWIVVGFVGALMTALMAVMAFTATGPFAPRSHVTVEVVVPPGEEVGTADVLPGSFLVLAEPTTVDVDDITCTWKSRVYSTGLQRDGELEIGRPDGAPETMTARDGRELVPVAVTGSTWMEADTVTCDGGGATAFALAKDRLTTTGERVGIGAFLAVVTPLLAGLGALALAFTRTWSREAREKDAAMRAHGFVPQAHPRGTWVPAGPYPGYQVHAPSMQQPPYPPHAQPPHPPRAHPPYPPHPYPPEPLRRPGPPQGGPTQGGPPEAYPPDRDPYAPPPADR